jgi:hypothetical protein
VLNFLPRWRFLLIESSFQRANKLRFGESLPGTGCEAKTFYFERR